MKKNLRKLLSAVLVLFIVLAAGCSSNDSEKSGGDSQGESKGNATTFTYAIGGEPTYLDPAMSSDSVTSMVVQQLYYPLFYIGEDGSTLNGACESYDVSEDGLVYTFHLIDNNYWSDGQKVTAADYVYGMKHAVGLGAADSSYSYFITDYVLNAKEHGTNMDNVADMDDMGIVALDENTIEITLKEPCSYFVALMPNPVFFPLREDYVKDHDYTWAANPEVPTNGPFHPVKIDTASEIVMEKNEHFTNADQVSIETLIAKVMPDMDAELMAFQTGEIDMATSVDSNVTKIYEGKEELYMTTSVINYYVNINCYSNAVPALQDVRVRRALQLGVDREVIVDALDAGDMYYPLYGLVPLGFEGATGDFRQEQDDKDPLVYTDKEEAKRLLKEAGYDENNPLQLTYYYNQNTMHDTVGEVLKAQLAEVNVEITLKTAEIRTFFDDRTNGLYELARNAMSADYMDVSNFADLALKYRQTSAHTWGDDTYDAMIAETRVMEGGAERYQALHDAEEYLVRDMAYTLPLFGYKNISLKRAGVEGVIPSPQSNYLFWYVTAPAK